MEELASSLLGTLKRSSAPVETKLSLLNSLKSSIKHQRVPDSAQTATIECIRIAITTQTSATLVAAGFATLTHLIKRLTIQEEIGALFTQRANLLPLLLDKLGDVKEAHRQASSQALCDLWPVRQVEVEKLIREAAIQGSNNRAKEAGIEWVTKMHSMHALQFRNFVGPIVECLEDAEGSVRDCAKANILELFRDARDAAKADLKRQLLAYNVRRSITNNILAQLQIPNPAEASMNASSHPTPHQEAPTQEHNSMDTSLADQAASSAVDSAQVEPLYVHSQRELEDMFLQMQPCFENREGEDNWKPRDTNTTKLRRLLQGNAPVDYHQAFMTGLKGLLDGILKVVNSLRTTMSTNGCLLVQELAKTLGAAMDPMVDMILQGLEKMSASTKHINGLNANLTIDTIFARVSYHIRLVQHVWHASQDKNVQPRTFASGWLKTILKKQIQHKGQFENSGGLELADKTIRKCLVDPNPKTRENMRSTFWLFAEAWPHRAEAIMATLDAKSRQLLEKDPSNPNTARVATSFTSSVGPIAAPNPRAAPSTGRSSLKDTIAAQKKAALAAQRLPERPNSAMSSFSPVRQAPPSAARAAPTPVASQARGASAIDTQPISRPPLTSFGTASGTGLLASAPMRRPRRPDLPRPATADVYANRRTGRNDTPPRSPVVSPARSLTNAASAGHASIDAVGKAKATDHTWAGPEVNGSVHSPEISTGRNGQKIPLPLQPATRPVTKPPAATRIEVVSPSPSPNDDQFTIIIPHAGTSSRELPSPRSRTEGSRNLPTRLSLPTMVEEDNFTLVMPRGSRLGALGSPKALQAPLSSVAEGQISGLEAVDVRIVPDQTAAVDFADAAKMQGSRVEVTSQQAENPTDDPLIIFEDPTLENIVIPLDEIESSRNALEELHLNAQQLQLQLEESLELEPVDTVGETERPISPSKKAKTDEDPLADRAEVLKTRRQFMSSMERLRTWTLDAQGFSRLHDLIKHNGQLFETLLGDVLQALLHFLQSSAAGSEDNKPGSHEIHSQALACVRAIFAVPLRELRGEEAEQLHVDAIRVVILQSGTPEISKSYSDALKATEEDIMLHLEDSMGLCLDRLSSHDWHQYSAGGSGHRGILMKALDVVATLMANVRARDGELSRQQRTQLSNLALRCLASLEPEVRRASVEFWLKLHGVFGVGNEGEFWRSLSKAGDAQMRLVVHYMVRSGTFSAVPAA